MTQKRVHGLDWLPIELASRDLRPGSAQIVLLYQPLDPTKSYLNYTTSNPDFTIANAAKHGYTEFALIVDD